MYQAPQVKIISAARTGTHAPTYSGNRVVFDIAEQSISVEVTFPDGVRRGIKSLQLEATDTSTGRSRAPGSLPLPRWQRQYSIPWTFDDFTRPGTVSTIDLTVTASDALGLTGTAARHARLTVAALPPPPEPRSFRPPYPRRPARLPPCNNLLFSVLAAFVLALILVIVFLIALLVRSTRRQASYARMAELAAQQLAPVAAPAPLPAAFPEPAPAPVPERPGEEELLGRLITISGLEVNEIRITEPEFTVGRDPSCNYIIDQPFVSPRHCTIMLANFLLHP